MKLKLIKGLAWLALTGLLAALSRWDAGFLVFPVFGENLRISPGLALVPLLGIGFGPLAGTMGALAGGYLAQVWVPQTAFAGEWTFAGAALTALICGLLVKRNWIGAFLAGMPAVVLWLVLSRGLPAAVFTLVFVTNLLVTTVLAGIFGTDFMGGPGPLYRLVGYLLVVWSGLSGGLLALAGLSAGYYTLPEYMWDGVALYQFLRFLFQFSGLALIPVWLGRMVIPRFFRREGDRLFPDRDNPVTGILNGLRRTFKK